VVPCDGAGKEVVPEAVKVLRAAGADFEFEELDINADAYLRDGVPIPADAWKKLAAADAILFGAVGDPRVPDPNYLAGVLLRLRFELDLYVNLRPAKLYDDRLSPLRREERRHIDLMVVRENTEGAYVGMGGRFKKGTADEVAIQEDMNTYLGVMRIIEHAFEIAKGEVVMVDKSNAMTFAGGLWQERWKDVAHAHPAIKTRHLFVDAAHAARERPESVRRHRHEQPLRRHPQRPHRRARGRHGHRAVRQHQPEDRSRPVRARPRDGAGHRRQGPREPDRGHLERRYDGPTPGSSRNGKRDRGGGRIGHSRG